MAGNDAELAFLRSLQQEEDTPDMSTIKSPATNSTKQLPRTLGGFMVDSDDGDDQGEEEMDTNGLSDENETGARAPLIVDRGSSNTPQRVSADSAVPFSAVSAQSAPQDQSRSQSAAPNGNMNDVSHATTVPAAGVVAEKFNDIKPASSGAALPSSSTSIDASATSMPKTRLPHDRVGVLEDRIKDDPRGDMDAWLSLISEHKKRNRLDDARSTYERLFEVFPSAAEQWVAYANMELDESDFFRVEQIFGNALLKVPNIELWSVYLNYVRRRNNLTSDPSGNARQIVNQTYEFVLQNVGNDKDAGPLWQDYIQFIRSGPGQVGGTGWQDQQKMDSLRKAYQRAVTIPTQAVTGLWKEYNAFEMGLNQVTGRKFMTEKSPSYMTARSSNIELQKLTHGLNRTTLPSLPPALGFEGEAEYRDQVDIWKRWIAWEKEDPLVLKEEDEVAYKDRILFVYKQALMALRFWPELWCDAAQFCFANGLETDGGNFLQQGATANPESCLLAFQYADRAEQTTTTEEGVEGVVRKGKAVREPYDKVLDALYAVMNKVKDRETRLIARIKESLPAQNDVNAPPVQEGEDDDATDIKPDPAALQKMQIDAVQKGNAAQIRLLSRTVSFVWIALMRAMRRVQGKGTGKPGDAVGGFRQIFADARGRGRLTSDVYIASALIEYHCYKDVAATKIFERGMKLFKDDEQFALEYLKHLVAINDTTNARAVFETTAAKFAAKPDTVAKAKPLFIYFHDFESRYGEFSQINKLEQRMRELFPEDPQLKLFAQRHTSQGFDPTAIRPIISPTQTRPPSFVLPSIEKPPSAQDSPRPSIVQAFQVNNSPKHQLDDSDSESLAPPRKLIRAESPLKGAAGRRMDAQKKTGLRNEIPLSTPRPPPAIPQPPPLLPAGILQLLSAIPRAETYNATRLVPERMVDLLRKVDLSKYQPAQQVASTPQPAMAQYGFPTTSAIQNFVR